jgi:DNA mismatch repair protein MutS2
LKRLAAESVGIVNASLQFDAATLTPTYRLLKGLPGRSYGLAIARRLGVAEDVLADAEQAVPDTERQLDALLADVEARARSLAERESAVGEAEAAAATERTRLDARAQDAAERERGVRDRERSLDAKAREQARAYLLSARKTVESALGQARAAVDEATAREARRMLERAISEVKEGDQAEERSGGPVEVEVGYRVRTADGMTGRVGELRDDGAVVLETGSLRIIVRPEQIVEVLGGAAASPTAASATAASPTARLSDRPTAGTEVSLRGLRADEAEAILERALDAAVLDDLPYLRIIHGKGTGALRELVQRMLQHDPRVARFGLAPANQGGSGVTVVELR